MTDNIRKERLVDSAFDIVRAVVLNNVAASLFDEDEVVDWRAVKERIQEFRRAFEDVYGDDLEKATDIELVRTADDADVYSKIIFPMVAHVVTRATKKDGT